MLPQKEKITGGSHSFEIAVNATSAVPTIFSSALKKTDKIDKSDFPSNQEFLEAIFGSSQDSKEQPIVVSFAGSPATTDVRAWKGTDWKRARLENYISDSCNNYFTLSVYAPDEDGFYSRKKKRFTGLYALMLDDVGTKVPHDRVKLTPSWALETSTGNFQLGYIFDMPVKNSGEADKFMQAVIAAGLCDPGAGGPTARLARLPVGINGKRDPTFSCRMKVWNPNVRYSIEELTEKLEISIDEQNRSKIKRESKQKVGRPDGSQPVYTPRAAENPVIMALKNKGLYKQPVGDGRHDITCPFVAAHSDGVDNGSFYFEPDDVYSIGGFKCFHGHCQHRKIQDLLEFLGVQKVAATMKSTIQVVPGRMHQIVDAAEQELAATGRYYQRGGRIVNVGIDPETREINIFVLKQPVVAVALASAVNWEKYDARTESMVPIDPPPRHVSAIHEKGAYQYLSVLEGLARQPYFRPDGTLVVDPGYDSETFMYGAFSSKDFPVSEQPSIEEARNAMQILESLLSEFPFATSTDRVATLSAFLSAAIRPSLPAAPMFHIRAPQKGCGKSYLCEMICAFSTSQMPSPSTFPHDDEECKKVLLSELRKSPAVVYFDNLKTDLLDHSSLCKALSSQYINERILGFSETARVPTRTLFLSSGNNVGPVQDMTRRCITINLDPVCEIPAARDFKNPNLLADLQRERGRYVSAALTVIRAWIVAGRPKQKCKNLAGFPIWSDLCRQSLLWLGYADPVEGVFEAIKSDPDQETLGRLLLCWEECFGKMPTMVRDAVGCLNPELQEILADIAPDKHVVINRRKLGHWIKRNENRIVNGRKFVRANLKLNAEAWRVETVLSVLSFPDLS